MGCLFCPTKYMTSLSSSNNKKNSKKKQNKNYGLLWFCSLSLVIVLSLVKVETTTAAATTSSRQQKRRHHNHPRVILPSSPPRQSSITTNTFLLSRPFSSLPSSLSHSVGTSFPYNHGTFSRSSRVINTIRGGGESSSTVEGEGGTKEESSTTKATPTTLTTTTSTMSTLTKIRQTIFPIYGNDEVRKFLLLGSIKFFIILALTLTRDTKDTLIVTQCGAEAIAFLKIYGVLPAATAFIALYSKMSNILPKKTLFYTTCIPFFAFFGIYDLFIHPNTNILHPTLAAVEAFLPGDATSGGMGVLARIISNWTSALFFVMAEIYSSVSVSLLFWQFANDVVPVDQAKRFYPLFAQMSGLAPVFAGQYVVRYASKADDFGTSIHRLTLAVLFAGTMICFFYYSATSFIEKLDEKRRISEGGTSSTSNDDEQQGTSATMKKKKKKASMSMTESAKFLASSQYLRLIAALVLGYGLSINFTEIMWKSLVKKQYPNPLEYQRFMGNFSSAVGIATCLVIFVGVQVIRILGWRVGAMATPAIMALLAAPFFACILMGLEESPTRLRTAVILGTIQSLLSKTSKYALFDPTTQMAYIPLDEESKVKGKAAIDVLGARFGKSGGSFIQQGLVVLFGNIINAAPVVGIIFYAVLFAWLSAANKLSMLFTAQTEMEKAGELIDDDDKTNKNSDKDKDTKKEK